MDIAKPDSWDTNPMPEHSTELDYSESFSLKDFEKISRGLIPQCMEDKWFIYLEGNILNFHRSWKGNCIYQIEFSRDSEKYTATRAIANRDPDQYKQDDDSYDSQMIHFLISNFLLGENEPFPMPLITA
jgi:hypothetical protein